MIKSAELFSAGWLHPLFSLFNSTGFVIRELLGTTIGAPDPQVLFDQMVKEGILALRKILNPKNADFPTTAVSLNRHHPEVRNVLAIASSTRSFRPIQVRGEPVSETLIRDRR